MNIITKFDIGDVFYLPRSYKKYGEDEIVNVDGKEYVHVPEYFVPVVKKKIVTGIDCSVREDDTVTVRYQLCGEGDTWPNHYDGEKLESALRTYGEALHIAEEYAIHKKEEYYG